MQTPIHWIKIDSPGRLGLAARPRGGDWLSDEVQSWHNAGVDQVVSLLTLPEAAELGLEHEADTCCHAGIKFISIPIPDRGVPASPVSIKRIVTGLADAISQGESIVVHCRQGIGRSALVAVCILAKLGIPVVSALNLLTSARGLRVPETAEQEAWLNSHASAMASPRPAAAGHTS